MGIFSWIFGGKSKRYHYPKVEKALGPWRPYEGGANLRGTRLPKTLIVPASLKQSRDGSGEITFSEALFPFWLRIDPSLAGYVLKKTISGGMYTMQEIPRPGKAPRIISAPAPMLKFMQRRILERILEQIEIHPAAHGFVKGRSIFSAAEPHVGKRIVVTMDVRDFFGTISFRRVAGMFKAYGISKKQALTLAGLCCLEKKLPQGAPTSPAISNIICRKLDSRLSGLCKRHDIAYTRYADDMIFSGDGKILKFLRTFREIIEKEGFTVAEEKTVIRRSGSRQRILGLNVNTKLSVPRRARRLVRAMVHRQSAQAEPDGDMISFLMGHASFMSKAHPGQAARLRDELKNLCLRST